MKFKDELSYVMGIKNQNGDAYGLRCFSYAKDWAEKIEAAMDEGQKLEDVAQACALAADTDGITGYMYGAAVSILSEVWEHGEELKRWHNGEMGSPDAEGVINPAIITVTTP